MFTNQGKDQGCGKWLTTKTTRKIAQSLKQKNTRGVKRGRRKPSAFKSDHGPGVVVSSTPMAPRLVEMLSRAKQAKVEQFFKPVVSKDQDKISKSDKVLKDSGFRKDCQILQSCTTPLLTTHHKWTSEGQEDLPRWDDDDLLPSNGQQNETETLNISGILLIEVSDSFAEFQSHDNNVVQGLKLSSNLETNLHEPSPDETIRSPIPKRFRSMTEESPTGPDPLSPFHSRFDDDDEKDSYSFHYTQWVNEQIRKSKELQINDSKETGFNHSQTITKPQTSSSGSPSSGVVVSTELNRKYSQDKHAEIFTETESQFHFSQWAFEQKAKCKRLQDTNLFDVKLGGLSGTTQGPHKKFKEFISHPESDSHGTDSNFQYTDWISEQKRKSKQIQQSSSQPKKVSQTDCRVVGETLKESDVGIPESEIFERLRVKSECGCLCEKVEDNSIIGKSKVVGADRQNKALRNIGDMKTSSRGKFKDVSNSSYIKSENVSTKRKINRLREDLKEEVENKELDEMTKTFATQDSEAFHFTEWRSVQKQICKQIHKEPETFRLTQDDFWDLPSQKKDTISRNEYKSKEKHIVVLASDTDQESDSETCSHFSL